MNLVLTHPKIGRINFPFTQLTINLAAQLVLMKLRDHDLLPERVELLLPVPQDLLTKAIATFPLSVQSHFEVGLNEVNNELRISALFAAEDNRLLDNVLAEIEKPTNKAWNVMFEIVNRISGAHLKIV